MNELKGPDREIVAYVEENGRRIGIGREQIAALDGIKDLVENAEYMGIEQITTTFFHHYAHAPCTNEIRRIAVKIVDLIPKSQIIMMGMGDLCAREFESLPNKITLYRGVKKGNQEGISWTSNLEVARWFACESVKTHAEQEGFVMKLVVNKNDIAAMMYSNEAEFIIKASKAKKAKIFETAQAIRAKRKSYTMFEDWMEAYAPEVELMNYY